MFVSLDVVSLFTTVPLKKTVDIILKRIYTGKEITTTHTKRFLKKSILDTCQKYGRSLGAFLANIIMIEYEKVNVNQLIENKLLNSM